MNVKTQEAILKDLQRKLGTLVERVFLCENERYEEEVDFPPKLQMIDSRINKSLRAWNC